MSAYTLDIIGQRITFADPAEATSSTFTGSWHDASAGETYLDEWSARGTLENGVEVEVIWRFEEVKGEESEPDTRDWENPENIYSVEEI